jgi:hypothetical protein
LLNPGIENKISNLYSMKDRVTKNIYSQVLQSTKTPDTIDGKNSFNVLAIMRSEQ